MKIFLCFSAFPLRVSIFFCTFAPDLFGRVCVHTQGKREGLMKEEVINISELGGIRKHMGVDEETILPIIQRPEEWLKKVEELKEKI